jgi:hypothetical protein
MNYHTSVFYYFYDYIKYQYLSYWANSSSNPNGAFSQAARQFTLPEVGENEKELMSAYVDRMWAAEKTLLARSYNGVYLMYRDSDYVFTEDDEVDPKDLFGLSYLFNMNSQHNYNLQGYPSENYLEVANSSDPTLENWRVTTQTQYNEDAGNYGLWLSSIEKIQSGTDETSSLPEFYPLAYLMDGYYWDAYTNYTDALKVDSSSDELSNYTFTPTYLQNNYSKWYENYPNVNEVSQGEYSSVRENESLKVENLTGQRAYARVYASKSQLGAHLGTTSNLEMTPLEKKLANCTKNIYNDVLNLTSYLQGDIRDSSLIFACALVATYDFNKEFSQTPVIGDQIYPQTLAQDSMTLDKFMRATFTTGVNEMVQNKNTLYMIAGQSNGGTLTVFFIIITEVMLILLLLARIAILTLLLIASAYLCTTFWLNPPKLRREITVGVLAQLGTFMVTQIAMILILTGTMNLISNFESNLYRTIAALGMAMCMLALLGLNIKMMLALVHDMKNYGGAIINNAVTTTLTDIRTRMTAMDNVELKTKISKLSVVKNNSKLNKDATTSKASNRNNNASRLESVAQGLATAGAIAGVGVGASVIANQLAKKTEPELHQRSTTNAKSLKERQTMHSNYNTSYTTPAKYKEKLENLLNKDTHGRVERRRYTVKKSQIKKAAKNKK